MELKVALRLLPSFEFGKLAPPPSGTPLDELPTFEQRQLDLSTGGRMTGSVDDRIIDRPESLPAERTGSKGGPAKSLRGKSLAAKEAPGLEELVLWCARARQPPRNATRPAPLRLTRPLPCLACPPRYPSPSPPPPPPPTPPLTPTPTPQTPTPNPDPNPDPNLNRNPHLHPHPAPSASPATTTTTPARCCRVGTSSTASASISGCSRGGRRAATVRCARSPSCKGRCRSRWTRSSAGTFWCRGPLGGHVSIPHAARSTRGRGRPRMTWTGCGRMLPSTWRPGGGAGTASSRRRGSAILPV